MDLKKDPFHEIKSETLRNVYIPIELKRLVNIIYDPYKDAIVISKKINDGNKQNKKILE